MFFLFRTAVHTPAGILMSGVLFLFAWQAAAAQARPVWKLLRKAGTRAHCPVPKTGGASGHTILRTRVRAKETRLLREMKSLGRRLELAHAHLLRLHAHLKTGAVYVRRNPRAVYQDGDFIFRNERIHTFFRADGKLKCFTARADIASVHGTTPGTRRVIRVYFGKGRELPLVRLDFRRGQRRYKVNEGRIHERVRLRVTRSALRNLREIVFAADRAGNKFIEPDL